MPNRDTYDIEEAERLDKELASQQVITNIQIPLVMDMMRDSEPDLFGNGTAQLMEVTVKRNVNPLVFVVGLMTGWAKWHANIQIEFWKDLMKPS